MDNSDDTLTIAVKFTIKKRWIPAFFGFLNRLVRNSKAGHSSLVGFYADGDGDFRFDAKVVNCIIEKEQDIESFDTAVAQPAVEHLKLEKHYWSKEVEEVYDAG